jgi:hypothetical protein
MASGAARSSTAARLAATSAVLAAIGVVCILTMFAAFAVGATSFALVVGRINDVLILVAYPLAAPGLLGLRALVRPSAAGLVDTAALLGIVAIAAIAVLQLLLVLDVLPFEQQVGPVTLALLAFGISLVLMGVAGRSGGSLPGGVRMGVIGATYLGFPLWARWATGELDGRAPELALPTEAVQAPGRP